MSGFSPSASSFATDQAVMHVAAKRVPADDSGHLTKLFGEAAPDHSQKLLLVCGLTVQNAGAGPGLQSVPICQQLTPHGAMDTRKRISPHASLFGTSDLVSRSRCVVIVAHSFDELIGAGGLISRLRDITVVHVTNSARWPESNAPADTSLERESKTAGEVCVSALALANVPSDRIIEFTISDIREPHALADLAKRLSVFLQRFRPDVVLTHPYEGGHPDHDATAFATHAALRLMGHNGFEAPALFEIGLHPSKDGERRELDFLPGTWHETTTFILDEQMRKLKRRMFECVATQERNLKGTILGREKFRRSPNYDFSTAPNAGRPAYEDFHRGMTGSEWQSVAQQALAELFPSETPHDRATRAKIEAGARAHSSRENSAHRN